MLSDESILGDSNRTEADGAGWFGDRSAPATFRRHFFKKKAESLVKKVHNCGVPLTPKLTYMVST